VHFLEFQSTYPSANVVYGEDSVMVTTLDNTASDLVFEYGGFIIITELVSEVQYTSTELASIYYALAEIESGDTDNLRNVADALRSYVGAPPPRPR